MNAAAALELMKQGDTLQIPASHMLVKMQDGRILLSSSNCFLKLSEQDFFALFGTMDFYLRRSAFEIDEARDREYYAWRREKQ